MFNVFDSCDVTSVTKILIGQIKAICIFPLTYLCSGFPLSIMALLATVVAVKVGDKTNYFIQFNMSFIINSVCV